MHGRHTPSTNVAHRCVMYEVLQMGNNVQGTQEQKGKKGKGTGEEEKRKEKDHNRKPSQREGANKSEVYAGRDV